jgi:hypothetical protein
MHADEERLAGALDRLHDAGQFRSGPTMIVETCRKRGAD